MRKILFSLLFGTALALGAPINVFAATIELSPSAGSVTKQFSADVVVNEFTDQFNAAQAQVTLSKNLTVTDLILGNCGFSFVKTPSKQDPSFVGVSLGTPHKRCVAYTLNIVANGSATGTVTISNAAVKRYGDAKELITGVKNGSYTVGSGTVADAVSNFFTSSSPANAVVPVTTTATTIQAEKNLDNYTVSVKVLSDANQPLKNSTVKLQPQLQAINAQPQEVTTNAQGVAEFKNVTANVYTVQAESNGEVLAEQIINAQGQQQVLTMGLRDEKPAQNPWIPVVAAATIILITGALLRRRITLLLRK